MKYKYLFTFHTVDNHVVELSTTGKERVDEADMLNALYRQGYMVGNRHYTEELTLVNMTNVVTVKVRIEEVL